MKRISITVTIIVVLIWIAVLNVSVNIPNENNSITDKALNITLDYGGVNNTVMDIIGSNLASLKQNGSQGYGEWSSFKIDNDIYDVSFDYKENGTPKSIKFKTNIKTGEVTSLNKMGTSIITTIHKNNPSLNP